MPDPRPHDLANLPHYLAVMTAKGVPHGWEYRPCEEGGVSYWYSDLGVRIEHTTTRDINALLGACVQKHSLVSFYTEDEWYTDADGEYRIHMYHVCRIHPHTGRGETKLAACIAAIEQLNTKETP